jgi:dihydroorotate dehydrogenase (fumarate)
MIDLATKYLGLELGSPFMLGASPLVADLDAMRRAEEAGASAIVMRSLFEEQITSHGSEGYTAFDRSEFTFSPNQYLEQIHELKSAVSIPVIGSLNGTTTYGWTAYAALIDQAGADALELNIYRVATDFERSAESIEDDAVQIVREVVAATRIPVAVKLSPFYTSLPHFARRLLDAGARGLVLFNRFYQPDVDLNRLEVEPKLALSTSAELALRLRWLAILSGRLSTSFAVTGGVHSGEDAIKTILVGAHGVQLVSEVLQHGFVRFAKIRREVEEWLKGRGYHSLDQARGALNLARSSNPGAYERANYLHVLHSWPSPEPSELG